MAPSRRKGSGKPAKAADNRQWNVGDLVLAKVKGFQAWPAVVSEPEKWGYSADWKKVLVHFFGTKQIAFCNPVEVEAFTEEKKKTLLNKRHGRGSDFVRAIQEIVDSYDNSSKSCDNSNIYSQINEVSSLDEVVATSVRNSRKSCDNDDTETENLLEIPTTTPLKTVSAKSSSGGSSPVNVVNALHGDCDEASLSCKSFDKREISAAINDFSVENSMISQAENHVDIKKEPDARRTRSSSRAELCKLNNSKALSSNVDMMSKEHKQDCPLNPKIDSKESIQSEMSTDTKLPNFDANCANVGHVCEIAMVEFDDPSSTVLHMTDYGDKSQKHDLEVDGKSNKNQNSIGLKKRRKQNRKLVKNDLSCDSYKLTVCSNTEAEVDKMCSSVTTSNILNERRFKEDGDGHLPLLKRARVRMSKPFPTEDIHHSNAGSDEKPSSEVCNHHLVEVNSSLSFPEPVTCIGDVQDVSGVSDKFLYSNIVMKEVEDKETPCQKPKSSHSFNCYVDAESTLPPSKRLHRALEAMSANISEDVSASTEIVNALTERKIGHGLLAKEVEFLNNSTSSFDSGISNSKPAKASGEIYSSTPVDNCFPHSPGSNDLNQFLSNELHSNELHTEGIKHQSVMDSLSEEPMFPKHGRQNDRLTSGEEDVDTYPLKVAGNEYYCRSLSIEPEAKDFTDPHSLEFNGVNSPSRSDTYATAIVSKSHAEGLFQREDASVNSLPDATNENDMCAVSKEVCQNSCLESNTSLSSSDIGYKASVDSVKRCIFSPSAIITGSTIYRSDKSFPDISSSTSPVKAVKSPMEAVFFGCSSTGDKIYKRDNPCNSFLQERIFDSSKEVNPYIAPALTQKSKVRTNCSSSSNANAALKSFGTIIRSLTRTKEIIGRATRVALDCAKLGCASKVVEIIARSLETESKLHKRVDLFFLVDSIIQCSRAMKGELGSVYLSTMEVELPRLLVAAAPPVKDARENHKQCQKVLRIWLERKIFPESTVRNLMRQLNCLMFHSNLSRSSRMERALNDPLRGMDGMLVDEYGSNSSFQLPDCRISRFLKDGDSDSDSDGGKFEAVTPEHNSKISEGPKFSDRYSTEKHCRVLEDVDGELEMEDVAPLNEEINGNCDFSETFSASHGLTNRPENLFQSLSAPPLPTDMPPLSPPLPSSPPPAAPSLFSPFSCRSSFPENRSYYKNRHTSQNGAEMSVVQNEGAPSVSFWPSSDPTTYRGYGNHDFPIGKHISEPAVSYHIDLSRDISLNVVPSVENGSSFYSSKASLLKPPLHVPSNHFSYVHKHLPRDERVHTFCSNRQRNCTADDVGVYSDMDRRNPLESCSPGERWRQDYVDDDKVSAFFCMESERGRFIRSQRRSFPSRRFDHRDFPPFYSRFDPGFSSSNRAPRLWQTRRR